uniref:Rabaptin coiled-coil domain-containing protein n=1 Tax=Ursus americanus TaxID=9643 RepID=A0A452R8Z9_URSAM
MFFFFLKILFIYSTEIETASERGNTSRGSGRGRIFFFPVSLQQRVAELEKINAEFLRAQQQLEQEFNQKRAKFKELYLAKEEDLKRQNAVLQAAQDDLGQLRTQLWEAQAEVENIKAIATVSENTKQEAIDEVKRQWREEVASLQAVMKETVRDYEHQLHLRLEQERSQWAQYRESADREIADLRRRLSEGQEEENLENEMKKVCRKILVCRSVRIRTQDASADLTAATADLSISCTKPHCVMPCVSLGSS